MTTSPDFTRSARTLRVPTRLFSPPRRCQLPVRHAASTRAYLIPATQILRGVLKNNPVGLLRRKQDDRYPERHTVFDPAVPTTVVNVPSSLQKWRANSSNAFSPAFVVGEVISRPLRHEAHTRLGATIVLGRAVGTQRDRLGIRSELHSCARGIRSRTQSVHMRSSTAERHRVVCQ